MRTLLTLLTLLLLTASTAWAGPEMLFLVAAQSCIGETTTYDFSSTTEPWINSSSGDETSISIDTGMLVVNATDFYMGPVAQTTIVRSSCTGGILSFKHHEDSTGSETTTSYSVNGSEVILTKSLTLTSVTDISYPVGEVTFIFKSTEVSDGSTIDLWLDDIVFMDN